MNDLDLDSIAHTLNQHEDYRVIRRFVPKDVYHPDDGSDKLLGVFLDVETTGLDSSVDKVIELALLPFEFSPDGKIFAVHDALDQLEDPNKPLDPEIVGITGITDEMLKNQRIDDDEVDRIISDAAVVIAHNARFDRPFVEQRWASFEQKAWACSLTQIPWGSLGFESAKLEYLAYRLGFFFHGHRAETDCRAGLEILSRTLQPKGEFALKVLLDEARRKSYRVWAVGAPFEAKDTLKARGYRWNNGENGKPRAWHKDVSEDLYEEEARYLSDSILQGNLDPIVDTISAFNRFSERG